MPDGFNSVNWDEIISNAEEAGELPDGEYVVEVVSVKEARSKNDKLQMKLRFKVATGPYVGYSLFDTLTYSPESTTATGIFIDQVRKIAGDDGFEAMRQHDFGRMQEIATGRFISVVKGTREYNGGTYDDIKGYKAVDDSLLASLSTGSATETAAPSTNVSSSNSTAAPPPPPPR